MLLVHDNNGNHVHTPELPRASGWMNYKGDQRSHIGEVKGPNDLNEMMTTTEVQYDPDTNKSRVGFAIGVHLSHDEKNALNEVGANYDPYR